MLDPGLRSFGATPRQAGLQGSKVDSFVKGPNRPLFVIPDERSEIRNPVISGTSGCRIKSGMTFRGLFTISSTIEPIKRVQQQIHTTSGVCR